MATQDRKLQKVAINVLVAVMFGASLYILFLAFAGYLSRTNLSQSVGNVDLLIYTLDRESGQQAHLKTLKEELTKHQSIRASVLTQHSHQTVEYNNISSRLTASLHPISQIISRDRNIFINDDRNTYVAVIKNETLSPIEMGDQLESIVRSFFPLTPDDNEPTVSSSTEIERNDAIEKLREAFRDFSKELNALRQISSAKDNSYIQIMELDAEIERVEKRIGESELQLARSNQGITDAQRAVIESFKQDTLYSPYLMLQLPTVVLTLLVTIAAGSLGSIVSFTRQFYDNETKVGLQKLFLSVCEGVAAAIAIFLLAGAGMLMLSQGNNTPNGSVEIGPYMVAFLAFISGFMAKDAFAKIEEVGGNLFSTKASNED